ncbi:MAG TPA: EAL domain-containing protein [Burkholderiales bacterium]|nr:EAL domain-containing protein [Burkholderiales bacterium]
MDKGSMMAGNDYTIQEVSANLGIPIQKLRRWDALGVLVAHRSHGGHRRYSRELIDRLASASAVAHVSDRQSGELAAVKKTLREKHRIIQLLLESESRYRDLVETSHDLIWATDALGRFTYLNNAALEVFGLNPEALLGRCFFDFEARPSQVSNRRFLATLKRHNEVKNYITHLITTSGDDRWIGINARLFHDEEGRIIGIRGTARDITEQHLAALRIQHMSQHDMLTDLPNRACLQQTLEAAIQSGQVGALLFLDIDNFKYVNDNFGHHAGDQMIGGISGALREVMNEFDGQLFRIGGDEFAIHLPAALRKAAVGVAEKALESVRYYRFVHGGKQHVTNMTASIGIALYPFHGNDVASLLSNVDIAMYQAKDHGRNGYALFDQDTKSLRSTHKRVHWAKKLRDALDEDRLLLYSQPVVRLTDRKLMHQEILLRMQDEQGKIILPGDFIEIAESIGVIQEIDMLVVKKLIHYLQTNPEKEQKRRYFVNLSRASISDPRWVRRFQHMLGANDIVPSQLVFEITETAAMSEIDVTVSFIRELKEMGCRFALDDFGSGFSSFYYVKKFDVDYLKIDGNFVRDLVHDESNRIFVKALNDVAKGLHKQVIAEWVENKEVLDTLIEMGTQYGQGYLFQHPLPLIQPPVSELDQQPSVA